MHDNVILLCWKCFHLYRFSLVGLEEIMSSSRAHSCKHPVNYLSWIKAASYDNIYLKTEQSGVLIREAVTEIFMHIAVSIELNYLPILGVFQ